MPLELDVDHERKIARFIGTDPVTADDVFIAFQQQIAAGAWGYAALVDLSAAPRWVPSRTDIERFISAIAAANEAHGPRGPVAFVVAGQDALFGMLRMHAIQAEAVRIKSRVFHSRADAERWLGF